MVPPFVVMLNGHAGCLKTTLSYLLAPRLGIGHVSTSVLGHITSERAAEEFHVLRERRYLRAFDLVDAYLRVGTSVIVDGTFALRRWRDHLYAVANRSGVEEIAAFTCICSRPSILRNRFRFRAENPWAPDAAADSMAAFHGSVREFEPLENDRPPQGISLSIATFDSSTAQVSIDRPTALIQRVAEGIAALVREGNLSSYLIGAFPPPPDLSALISVEGVSGSGKTTQAHAISYRLSQDCEVPVVLHDEFSRSPLGDMLRGERGCNLRVRPAGEDELTACFIVLTDFLRRLEDSWHRSAIHILDGGALSRLAHFIALRPGSFPESAWMSMLDTIDRILGHSAERSVAKFTIFLDCPPSVALQRLQRREGTVSADDTAFLTRLHQAFGTLLRSESHLTRVDATDEVDQVTEAILDTLSSPVEETPES